MIPYQGRRATFALTIALALSTSACRDAGPAADKRADPVPAPTSAAPPEPSVDCDALLTPAEIEEACGFEASAPADQPTDDIGEGSTCSRRWGSSKEGPGPLKMLIVRHASADEAKERFRSTGEAIAYMPRNKAVTGLGDMARRRYRECEARDSFVYYDSVESVKGRFNVLVSVPFVEMGPLFIPAQCDDAQLEKITAKVVGRLP